MYLEHYGLKEPPFSITPDPRFVFLSERHRDALAHLLFGIGQGGGGGFVQLTGEVGTGKTTLSRLLLEQIPQLENSVPTRVALVLNPRLSPVELLETICEELHLDIEARRGSVKALTDALNAYLLEAYAQGLRVVLIIDEAQNLSVEALEQVRLLTNLETDTQKLLQIILLGQPELRDMLARADLRQLAQRITARFHLTPLDAAETTTYLRHRFRVAGGLHLPFDNKAIARIHHHSGGVPRLINVIAERALLGGYAHDDTRIDARTVDRAARETLPPQATQWPARRWLPLAAGVAAVVLVGLYSWRSSGSSADDAATAAGAVAEARANPQLPSAPASPSPALPALDPVALPAALASADPSAAWRHLLQQWSMTGDAALASACPFAIANNAYCLRGRARLDRLVAQDRPVLLMLRDGAREVPAVLLGADALRVRLRVADAPFDIDRIQLARIWNGDYAAVWRGPAHLTLPLADNAPQATWVRERLSPRYLAAADVAPGTMQDAIRRFQTDRGLASDGVIGPETLMALAAQDKDGPRLLRELQ
ncbi:ExeA family protein [Lysobacter fragariae]